MPLNPEAVGSVGDVRTMSWNSKDALLYAVGIGAGQNDLPFTTENTKDVAQVVFPTFAVVAGSGTTSRSEERRVGKECRLLCRSRGSPYP